MAGSWFLPILLWNKALTSSFSFGSKALAGRQVAVPGPCSSPGSLGTCFTQEGTALRPQLPAAPRPTSAFRFRLDFQVPLL